MRGVVRQFLERGLIADGSRTRFAAAVSAALRLRNSVVAEVLLLVFVYIGIVLVWPHYNILHSATSHSLVSHLSPRAVSNHARVSGSDLCIFQLAMKRDRLIVEPASERRPA